MVAATAAAAAAAARRRRHSALVISQQSAASRCRRRLVAHSYVSAFVLRTHARTRARTQAISPFRPTLIYLSILALGMANSTRATIQQSGHKRQKNTRAKARDELISERHRERRCHSQWRPRERKSAALWRSSKTRRGSSECAVTPPNSARV